jgi:hypothetical protein
MNLIEFNKSPEEINNRRFKLHRALINYLHLAAFKSRILNHLFYNSALADGLHEVLWTVRKKTYVKRILYGKYGTGEAKRGGGT